MKDELIDQAIDETVLEVRGKNFIDKLLKEAPVILGDSLYNYFKHFDKKEYSKAVGYLDQIWNVFELSEIASQYCETQEDEDKINKINEMIEASLEKVNEKGLPK